MLTTAASGNATVAARDDGVCDSNNNTTVASTHMTKNRGATQTATKATQCNTPLHATSTTLPRNHAPQQRLPQLLLLLLLLLLLPARDTPPDNDSKSNRG
jgi:hypothetical protein